MFYGESKRRDDERSLEDSKWRGNKSEAYENSTWDGSGLSDHCSKLPDSYRLHFDARRVDQCRAEYPGNQGYKQMSTRVWWRWGPAKTKPRLRLLAQQYQDTGGCLLDQDFRQRLPAYCKNQHQFLWGKIWSMMGVKVGMFRGGVINFVPDDWLCRSVWKFDVSICLIRK